MTLLGCRPTCNTTLTIRTGDVLMHQEMKQSLDSEQIKYLVKQDKWEWRKNERQLKRNKKACKLNFPSFLQATLVRTCLKEISVSLERVLTDHRGYSIFGSWRGFGCLTLVLETF